MIRMIAATALSAVLHATRGIDLSPLRDRERDGRERIEAHAAEIDNRAVILESRKSSIRRIEAAIPDLPAEARSRATADLAARAQSPGGLAELAGTTIGASIDAVSEAIRRHGREGAIARYLLTMEKYLLPDGDRRRVERPGGYFRKLTGIPDRGIAASFRALENARAA